jgi:hypothetical protein
VILKVQRLDTTCQGSPHEVWIWTECSVFPWPTKWGISDWFIFWRNCNRWTMQHILVDIFLSYSFSSSIQTVEPTQKTHNDEKNLRRRGEQASIHVGCEQFRFFWDIHIWTPLLLTISQYKSTKCKLTSTILFQMTQNHKVLQSGFALNHYHHRW